MLENAKSVLITGGCGTLGKAILKRSVIGQWDCQITVFSTDAMKHLEVKKMFPHVHSVIGDIRDATTVYNVMAGKDVAIHAAACKHIPVSEVNSIDTFEINVTGSLNVAQAAIQHGVKHVIGISTDKACHSANAYGATKYLMEKCFQEYSRLKLPTRFHLVRYGNVLESTGSVIEVWKNQLAREEPIRITDPNMTRFFISPQNAVSLIQYGLMLDGGVILIPKMKSLSIGKLAEYTLDPGYETEIVPLRPGEKTHETLLTIEEGFYAQESQDFIFLKPTTSERNETPVLPYTSDIAPELSRKELETLLEDR